MLMAIMSYSNCSASGEGMGEYIYSYGYIVPWFMTAVTAIAWYNSIEILILIVFTFKKYTGLYFWALFCTNLAVIPWATGTFK
jgi:hypothetical protein